MQKIDHHELDQFIEANSLLFGTVQRPGIMLTSKNEIVKFIYPRKKFSKAIFFSQAANFEKNAKALLEKGITGPIVSKTAHCQAANTYYVVYEKLAGEEVRDLCDQSQLQHLTELAHYLAELHDKGIYFRALHLGNVLKLEDGNFALIDIADLKTKSRSLSAFARGRNIAHMFNVSEDKVYFQQFGVNRFLEAYFQRAKLTDTKKGLLVWRMKRRLRADMRGGLGTL
ncbi:MAG: hypothetical protein P8N51_06550 [Pseudomonadales bacterium]|nr:hypothetical protein [Pseudomonadales bacterium]